jgi:hypothetical protein
VITVTRTVHKKEGIEMRPYGGETPFAATSVNYMLERERGGGIRGHLQSMFVTNSLLTLLA